MDTVPQSIPRIWFPEAITQGRAAGYITDVDATVEPPRQSLPCIVSMHYRLALAFRSHVVRWLPLKRVELSDQLDRVSLSIALNIAPAA